MCLTVKKGCKIEIAEEDITTYKYINDYDENYWCGIFYPYPRFLYNEIQKAKLHREINSLLDDIDDLCIDLKHLRIEKCRINEGFHSHVNPCGSPFTIKKTFCIIPKGSEYCFGEYNEIVSNQIIVFKTKEDYDKYITSKISSD